MYHFLCTQNTRPFQYYISHTGRRGKHFGNFGEFIKYSLPGATHGKTFLCRVQNSNTRQRLTPSSRPSKARGKRHVAPTFAECDTQHIQICRAECFLKSLPCTYSLPCVYTRQRILCQVLQPAKLFFTQCTIFSTRQSLVYSAKIRFPVVIEHSKKIRFF